MDLKLLLEWWNLIFILPFFLGIVFLVMQVVGLGGELGHDADHDMDHDLDHDVDHDLDHDVDHDLDHDVDHDLGHDVEVAHHVDYDHDADHDVHHDHDAHAPANQGSALWKIALLLGVGRVPVSIVLMTLCFAWGVIGYGSNLVLHSLLRTPWLFVPISFISATVLSIAATGLVARGVARVVPKTTTFTTRETDLVGKIGESLYKITPKAGTIRVKDNYGNLQQYPAYSLKDDVPANSQVLLVKYDPEQKAFAVEPWSEEMKA